MSLSPLEGTMKASVTIELAPERPRTPTIDFFLNRGLHVGDVSVDGDMPGVVMESDMEHFPFSPAARRVTVPVSLPGGAPAPGARIERHTLEVSYEGTIAGPPGGLGRIGAGLSELNLYGAWFPLFEGPQGFGYDVTLDLPGGYDAWNGGAEIPPDADASDTTDAPGPDRVRRRFTGRSSAGDVAILVASGYTHVPVEDGGICDVDVYSTGLPGGMQERVAAEAAWGCDHLASATGWPETREGKGRPRLLLVIVPREDPGYARPPLVVAPAGWFVESGGLPQTDEQEAGWRRRLFHEIAHGFAPLADTLTYHDWINEGLAEDLALQAVAARRGAEAAARYYRRYILEIAERPPAPPVRIPEFPREPPAVAQQGAPGEPGAGAPAAAPPGPEPGTEARDPDDEDREAGEPDGPGPAAERSARSILLTAISVTRRSDPDAALLYYRKGALIFRMIEGIVGEGAFSGIVAGLRAAFPDTGAARMTSADLIEALEKATGTPFGWLQEDWIDGTSLPRLSGDPEVSIRKLAGGLSYRVLAEIRQAPGRVFSLRLPVLARKGAREFNAIVPFSGPAARAEWTLDFKPAQVLADPERFVPRFDATVDRALVLRDAAERARDLANEGLAAERSRDPGSALARYEKAAGVDPSASYLRYREGRALSLLGRPAEARKAHEASLDLGEREAAAWERAGRACASAPAMACSEPVLWVDKPLDLRSWNWIRIGQIEDAAGRRNRALKAYERALEEPDAVGAHDKARSCQRAACSETAPLDPAGR